MIGRHPFTCRQDTVPSDSRVLVQKRRLASSILCCSRELVGPVALPRLTMEAWPCWVCWGWGRRRRWGWERDFGGFRGVVAMQVL